MDFKQQQHNAGTKDLSGGIVIIKIKMLFDKHAWKKSMQFMRCFVNGFLIIITGYQPNLYPVSIEYKGA